MDNFDIDVVITWVDGSDPTHSAKRRTYSDDPSIFSADDIAGDTRFANNGELIWCVRSINKFLPWVRKIFIVTDSQDPQLQSQIPIEIIDHKVIFQGYEQYLPTFCSVSIETMLWRIPDLSEHYIYFNDDWTVMRPMTREQFFPDPDHVICYGHHNFTQLLRAKYYLKARLGLINPINHVVRMLNAAQLTHSYFRFIRLGHTPHPLLKSVYTEYFRHHPEHIQHNIRHRFRSDHQFRNDVLAYAILEKQHRLILVSDLKVVMDYLPSPDVKRLQRKLNTITKPHSPKLFACFGSLDKATPQIYSIIQNFMENRLK